MTNSGEQSQVTPDSPVEALHRAICEDSLAECFEWEGRCVQALEAVMPYIGHLIVRPIK